MHAGLKRWYAQPGDRFEVPVDGYVVDIVRDELLIEVQTRGFASLRQKVTALLTAGRRVRIVHSIPIEKWIVRVGSDDTVLGRRRSPRHGSPADVFSELVSFPALLNDDLLDVHVLMTREEEVRVHTPGRSWRRNGWSVVERRLLEVVDDVLLAGSEDMARLLPDGLPTPFTTADLATAVRRPRRAAQQMAYCLRQAGAISAVGKRGNAIEYRLTD